MQLDWLDDGALQLLVPAPLLSEWHGVESADYGRACAAPVQWLSRLPVGDGFGLLLGGDPASVLVAMGEDSVVTLVRWVFADDEQELVDFALRGE